MISWRTGGLQLRLEELPQSRPLPAMPGMMESMLGRGAGGCAGGWAAARGLSLSGLEGGEGWPGCSLASSSTESTLALSPLIRVARLTSSTSGRDFRFLRLTFLFLVEAGAGLFLLLSSWSDFLRR